MRFEYRRSCYVKRKACLVYLLQTVACSFMIPVRIVIDCTDCASVYQDSPLKDGVWNRGYLYRHIGYGEAEDARSLV